MGLLGKGILKGMGVTAKNFFGSYVDEERLPTVEYPEAKSTVTHFSRNVPFLLYDTDDPIEGIRCTSCQICEKQCPPQCIYIERDSDETGKAIKRPKVFDIDFSVCMGCQICVEVCPFEAIRMDSEFELSNPDRFEGLLVHRDELLKPNSYYHEIHPEEAQETDDRIAREKAEKEAKKKAREAKLAAKAKATPSLPKGLTDPGLRPKPKAEVADAKASDKGASGKTEEKNNG